MATQFETLACDLHQQPKHGLYFRAVVWKLGGCINGSHQPYTVLDVYEMCNEARVRATVERVYPGVVYARQPEVINGKLYP